MFLDPVGVMMISLFLTSMVILASSSFKPVRETSTDFDRYCLVGSCSWFGSGLVSCLTVTGEVDSEDLSPGLEPGVNLLYRTKMMDILNENEFKVEIKNYNFL